MKKASLIVSLLLNLVLIGGLWYLVQSLGGFSYMLFKMKHRGATGVYELLQFKGASPRLKNQRSDRDEQTALCHGLDVSPIFMISTVRDEAEEEAAERAQGRDRRQGHECAQPRNSGDPAPASL